MATEFIKIDVDPDGRLKKAVSDAIQKVGNLTVPFKVITRSWFKGNNAIFDLKGPGKYQDITTATKKFKIKKVGAAYPILFFSGKLADSITKPDATGSIALIINKTELHLGTSIPYGIFHQSGKSRSKIPYRPFILLGAEQTAPASLSNRREAWIKVITDYVEQVSGEAFK